MARQISASNAVVQSCEQAAALFGVPTYRMNSRTFTVVGAGGRERPMFMGGWKDRFGKSYRKGMADLLMTPRIFAYYSETHSTDEYMAVPLWIECKAGSGRLTPEQKAFRDDVIERGAFYLEIHDGPDALIQWFQSKGVKR